MKRRSFIKNTAAAGAAFTIVPSFVLGGKHIAPSDTLYIGAIGVGGRGGGVVNELFATGKVKFVAMCDVDDARASASFLAHPGAKKYRDFRKLYDGHLKEIDAVMVATPDHTHATIALPFMKAKKHAYVEKPLTHNIYEARMMASVAAEQGIVTQMGNQGASGEGIRLAQEWINAGVIGMPPHDGRQQTRYAVLAYEDGAAARDLSAEFSNGDLRLRNRWRDCLVGTAHAPVATGGSRDSR